MKRQRNTTQMKEQTRNTEVQINDKEIGKLPEKVFRIMIVKMITNLETKREKMQESINKDLEELKNKHANNTITKIKNALEGIDSRLFEAEEQISKLEDKMVEITSAEQNKVNRMKRMEDSLRNLWDNIKCTNIKIIGVPEVSEAVLSSFHSFYFILLCIRYFYHFIFQLTDLFFCFIYSAIDYF